MKKILVLLVVFLYGPFIFAHSGGTDANGCHTNRKTGQYHCHAKRKPTVKPTKSSTETVKKPVLPKKGA